MSFKFNSIALATDGDVLVGGNFTEFDGQPRDGLARPSVVTEQQFFGGKKLPRMDSNHEKRIQRPL